MKHSAFIICLFFTISCCSQTSKFTDSRDNQLYNTIAINGKQWFRENLRFQTTKSFFPAFSKDTAIRGLGNFYSNNELGNICPAGWHVATIADWESYIQVILKTYNINGGVLQYDSLLHKEEKNYSLNLKHSILFTDTLLRLQPTGWVEGSKIKNEKNLNLWIVDTATLDDKYHLHIGKTGYIKHTHSHNIIDKPAKVRKFAVRCVCDLVQKN
jgi:uncharacterized protein (TIGR02145 family)